MKASEHQAAKAAADQNKDEESTLYSVEYYAAQKAKRQGLGLITFISELFKLQMLTECIMHEWVKKLLGNVKNPEEEEIESLCKLLTTVSQILAQPRSLAASAISHPAVSSRSTYVDFVPSARGVLPSQYDSLLLKRPPAPIPPPPTTTASPATAPPPDEVYCTVPDVFGVFHEYARCPQCDLEANVSLEAVCDAPRLENPTEQDAPKYTSIAWITRSVVITVDPTATTPDYGPFQNTSQFPLMDYFYSRSDFKSLNALDDLVAIIWSPGFSLDDLEGFTTKKAECTLEVWMSPSSIFSEEDGWHAGSVDVPLPKTGEKYKAEEDALKFNITGIIYRRLLPFIKGVVQDSASRFSRIYHWLPHCKFWTPPEPARPVPSWPVAPPLGSTSATLPMPPSPIRPRIPSDAPDVEYIMLPLLFWSDAMQLANFGSASLWPIYLYFGNLSKYVRGRPTEFVVHHLAYIPSPPDALKDAYTAKYGCAPSDDILKFCKRDLFQQIWLLLFDEEFMHAYEHSILLTCGDGVLRRVFPRVFTYSADYSEKVLVAVMQPLVRCLCPWCLTPKDKDTAALQKQIQTARKHIFKGYAIADARIDNWLKEESFTPIQSAFSKCFSPFNVNFYDILAPDLMHEFELSVWKGVFTHLMRMLTAKGTDVVEEFNSRMRRMPTFGQDRICRFWHNVASRKRLAVRNYEAFLITIMPAFEELLDLPDDHLGDYADYIERSGSTDNYNTQVGELEHRHVKRFYAQTNKIEYEMQIARKECKRALLAAIRETDPFQPLSQSKQDNQHTKVTAAEMHSHEVPMGGQSTGAPSPSPPSDHYAVSKSARETVNLATWLDDYKEDPAVKDFMLLLFDHLAHRLLGHEAEPEDGFSQEQVDGIHILNDRLYSHHTIHVNYTTYNMRREQDTINPRTHADVIILSPDHDGHPYWYARVINIFHANVCYVGPGAMRASQKWQCIDFMWVRWFEPDPSYLVGFQHRRLPHLQFVDASNPDNTPFGFLDPDDIIRGAYLIPAFNHGATNDLLRPSKLA
ncbi:hypothetical protein LXA43DRAFT_1108138 [Ganoderma leucocontextum]|nr:hypothetical protein LXA43DRAFT_1108138 [Ganoderma leucocontextum]